MIPAGEIPDFLWFCCGVEIFIINKIKPHAGFCCGFSDHLLLAKKNKYSSISTSLLFLSISFHVQISNYCFFFCLIPAYHFLFNLSSIIPIHFISYAVAYAAMSSRRPRAAARNLSRATTIIQVRGVPVSIVQGGGTAINFQLSPSRLGRCVVCYCYQWTNYSLLLRLHHAQLHDVERRPKGKSLVPVHGHD